MNPSAKLMMSKADQATAPSGAGYVFTLEGVHYHDDGNPATGQGTGFIQHYFLDSLQKWRVTPAGSNIETPVGQIGISHATITSTPPPKDVLYSPSGRPTSTMRGGMGVGGSGAFPGGAASGPMPDSAFSGAAGGGALGGAGGRRPSYREEIKGAEDIRPIKQNIFTIQFVWKPTLASARTEESPAAAAAPTGDQPAATDATPREMVPGVGVPLPKQRPTLGPGGMPAGGMPGGMPGGFGPAGGH